MTWTPMSLFRIDSLELRSLVTSLFQEPPSITGGASHNVWGFTVFWSPDSRFLVYQSAGKIRKIDIAGGRNCPLNAVAAAAGIPFRTAQRWVSLYRQFGLGALARKNASPHRPLFSKIGDRVRLVGMASTAGKSD